MIDQKKLVPVARHAHYRAREAEDLSLDAADREKTHQHGTGRCRRPASSQTHRPHVLAFGQVHYPLLTGVPGGEVQALQLAVKDMADITRSSAAYTGRVRY